GDVILAVNGHDIDRVGDLRNQVSQTKPGSTADLRVWRDGKASTLKAQVEQLEEKEPVRTAARQGAGDETARLGIAVRPLTPDEKKQVETEGDLVVEEVSGPGAGARPAARRHHPRRQRQAGHVRATAARCSEESAEHRRTAGRAR